MALLHGSQAVHRRDEAGGVMGVEPFGVGDDREVGGSLPGELTGLLGPGVLADGTVVVGPK